VFSQKNFNLAVSHSGPYPGFKVCGGKYFLGVKIFVFIICKTNTLKCNKYNKKISEHNKIWGAQKEFGDTAPKYRRGYEPVAICFSLTFAMIWPFS